MGDGAFQDTSLSDGRLRQDSGQPDPVTRNAEIARHRAVVSPVPRFR